MVVLLHPGVVKMNLRSAGGQDLGSAAMEPQQTASGL